MYGPVLWRFGRAMDPWPEIQRLQQEMNRIFSSASQPYGHEFSTMPSSPAQALIAGNSWP